MSRGLVWIGQCIFGSNLSNESVSRSVRAARVVAITLALSLGLFAASSTGVVSAGAAKLLKPVAGVLTGYAAAPTAVITMKETVSDCYYYGGQSIATVSVEVSWTGMNDGDQITVSLPGALNGVTSRVITQQSTQGNLPGTSQPVSPILSPQVVAFVIPATFSGTLSASGTGGVTAASIPIARSSTCTPQVCGAGNLGGTVFADYNRDGVKQASEYAGVGGVLVSVYGSKKLIGTVTTNSAGVWCTSIPLASYPVRVEFTNIPAWYSGGRSTVLGTDSQSTVQFLSAPDNTVDLGVVDPRDYCQLDPTVMAPCYVTNDPLAAGSTAGPLPVMVRFPYSSSGLPGANGVTSFASAAEVGSVWGLAYQRVRKYLYVASTLRRHAGYGPKGLGGIYIVDPYGSGATGNVLDSWNVEQDLNIAVQDPSAPIGGSINGATANVGRGLLASKSGQNHDTDAFDAIGKVGIGGIGLNDDATRLVFVNQYDKKLYIIDVSSYDPATPSTKPGPDKVTSSSIPNPGCVGGQWRPSGVKVFKGLAYVGGVCDASTSLSISDLRAGVMAYDLSAASWKQIFDFPLTYPKGASISVRGWKPWISTWAQLQTIAGSSNITGSQPMFTDIALDVDGAMVLGFNDRTGMQTARSQYSPVAADTSSYSGFVGGDLLRAFFSGSAFVLENNAKAGPNAGAAPNNYEGPGFGEFYYDNWNVSGHSETFQGGIAIRPGSGEVISSAMDPIDSSIWATGVRVNSNLNGSRVRGVAVYTNSAQDGSNYIGKSTGLGDVELGCDLGGDIEIGNRIFFDKNGNGRQDANEPGVGSAMPMYYTNDVVVELYKGSTKVGQTTASPNGDYKFNSSNVNLGGASGLLPHTEYEIRINMAQMTIPAMKLPGISTKDNVNGPNGDARDSDAELINNNAVIKLTTGEVGEVEHTYDFGFTRLFLRIESNAIGNDVNNDISVRQDLPAGGFGVAGKVDKNISNPSGGKSVLTPSSVSYMVPKCLTPGGMVEAMVSISNPTATFSQPDNPGIEFSLELPPMVSALYYPSSKTGFSGNGTVRQVGYNRIEWDGQLLAGDTLTISYFIQAGDFDPATELCADATLYYDSDLDGTNESEDTKLVCSKISCPPLGTGTYPKSTTALVDQKPGSVLIYNLYTSSVNTDRQNTRVTMTNVHPALPAYMHLFFIDGATCSMADRIVTLTPNQTVSLLMSDEDPGVTGYIIAISVDEYGCPNSFNYLIGESLVKFESGHMANLPAIGVAAVLGGLPVCGPTSVTATLKFDGTSYMPLPRTLALDSLPTRAEGNDTMMVLNRIGGDLTSSVLPIGVLNGLLFNDSETSASFTMTGNLCQLRGTLNNNFPRTAPRYDQLIPAGRTGWMKLSTVSDTPIVGAMINTGPRFRSGHNLHTLTTTTTAELIVPVYPPL